MSIIDYAQKYGDQTFDEMPFNEIDNLVLCNILYCDYQKAFENLNHPEKISLGMLLFTAIEKLDLRKENRGLFLGNKPLRLAKKIYNSKRYKNILASDYREITNQTNNTQFAAICYHIADNLIFLCFRGTDDSVSGWMENLDLLIEEKMPSQNYARDYLNEMMDKYHDYSFILGGHSKGGNLCIYAATYGKIENQDRILKIFSNDGTGFYPHVFDYSRFEKLKKRSLLIAPAHCLVGNILEQPVKNRLIIATKKNGLFSHDLNNW
ncbi:MAG TPA: DUF2974 domain-containing protein, partial [Bacilli bacterium]|nr:DUF2974 domain-containing protein [Bacilli bacterium]